MTEYLIPSQLQTEKRENDEIQQEVSEKMLHSDTFQRSKFLRDEILSYMIIWYTIATAKKQYISVLTYWITAIDISPFNIEHTCLITNIDTHTHYFLSGQILAVLRACYIPSEDLYFLKGIESRLTCRTNRYTMQSTQLLRYSLTLTYTRTDQQ